MCCSCLVGAFHRQKYDSQKIPAFSSTNTNALFLPMLCGDVVVGAVFVCDLFIQFVVVWSFCRLVFTSAFCLFQLRLCILNLLIPLPIEFKRDVHCKFLAALCSRTDCSCTHCWCNLCGHVSMPPLIQNQTGTTQPRIFKHFTHCTPAYAAALPLPTRRRRGLAIPLKESNS